MVGLAFDLGPRGQKVPGAGKTPPPALHARGRRCADPRLSHSHLQTLGPCRRTVPAPEPCRGAGRPSPWRTPTFASQTARRRHTSELPERARRPAQRQVPRRADSGTRGPCGRGRGPAGAGRWRTFPAGHTAALRTARGVCAGPMFTELSTQLSPPRGRAGAVRAAFGERRDVDGERGWTRGSRGLGAWGPRGRGGTSRTLSRGRRSGGGRGVSSLLNGVPSVFVLRWVWGCRGLRPLGSTLPWLGGGDRSRFLSVGWHHREVPFFFAGG